MAKKPVSDYIPADIERHWQKRWEDDGLYHADIDPNKPKFYALTMLPYPSGDLHIDTGMPLRHRMRAPPTSA